METLIKIFGEGKDLSVWQMSARGTVVFLIALILIRVSGRRSFGIRTALDNIIVVMLGATLSRTVVGASPFLPVVVVSFVIVMMHRMFAWGIVRSKAFSNLVEGKRITLYMDGHFIKRNMEKALVCEEDVMQGVRKSALTEDLAKVKLIYMERNGEITTIKNE